MALRRTGVYTILQLLQKLCNAITKFSPILYTISGGDPAVTTALSATMTACEGLRIAIEGYRNEDY